MEEAPENGKELSHSAHTSGMNKWMKYIIFSMPIFLSPVLKNFTPIFAPFNCLSKVLFLVLIISHNVFTSPSPACFAKCIPIQFSKLLLQFSCPTSPFQISYLTLIQLHTSTLPRLHNLHHYSTVRLLPARYLPWLTDTGVIIDAINTLSTIHTATLSAVFIIGLTVDTRETKGARACVGVDILVTGGTIVAWTRNTFIHIYLTVLAAKSIHTKACVVTNPIKTRSTILTRNWNQDYITLPVMVLLFTYTVTTVDKDCTHKKRSHPCW